jgi:beta-glucosidase-like glycosyl hydrolase
MVMQKTVNKLQKLQLRQVLIWIWNLVLVGHLVELVQEGKVSENLIDDAARRILSEIELGLFDNPYKYCDETREKKR